MAFGFAAIAFAWSSVVAFGMKGVGERASRAGSGNIFPQVSSSWEGDAIMSALFGFCFAVTVYLSLRKHLPRALVFRCCYLVGLALLVYCLGMTFALFPVLDFPEIMDDRSSKILLGLFSGPVFCLVLIPSGLLFLVLAIILDQRSAAGAGKWMARIPARS